MAAKEYAVEIVSLWSKYAENKSQRDRRQQMIKCRAFEFGQKIQWETEKKETNRTELHHFHMWIRQRGTDERSVKSNWPNTKAKQGTIFVFCFSFAHSFFLSLCHSFFYFYNVNCIEYEGNNQFAFFFSFRIISLCGISLKRVKHNSKTVHV